MTWSRCNGWKKCQIACVHGFAVYSSGLEQWAPNRCTGKLSTTCSYNVLGKRKTSTFSSRDHLWNSIYNLRPDEDAEHDAELTHWTVPGSDRVQHEEQVLLECWTSISVSRDQTNPVLYRQWEVPKCRCFVYTSASKCSVGTDIASFSDYKWIPSFTATNIARESVIKILTWFCDVL